MSTFIDKKSGNETHLLLDKWNQYFDYMFNVIFIFEYLIKSICLGLVIDNHSFLRDSWN